MAESSINVCVRRIKALVDTMRLRLVSHLFERSCTVTELCEILGGGIVKVSHHLKVLRHAEIVQSLRQGRMKLYVLHPDVVPTKNMNDIACRIDFGCCCLDLSAPPHLRRRRRDPPS